MLTAGVNFSKPTNMKNSPNSIDKLFKTIPCDAIIVDIVSDYIDFKVLNINRIFEFQHKFQYFGLYVYGKHNMYFQI